MTSFYERWASPEPSYPVGISGNNNLSSESLTAFELGYREQLSNRLRLDVTAFLNKYDDILAYVARGNVIAVRKRNLYRDWREII